MASGQNKISPRKFSEKIALLNKKEAEGNAEFEEIIKEVQATRSQCNTNDNGTSKGLKKDNSMNCITEQWQSQERHELEEVFQNLIRTVGQYREDEVQQQQQQQQQQFASQPDMTSQISGLRSVSAGLPGTTTNNFQEPSTSETTSYFSPNLPESVNQSVACGQVNSSATTATTNDLNYIIPFQDQISAEAMTSFNQQQQQHQGSTACRARVTSIGSAAIYKNVCANNNCNDSWPISGTHQMFLKPNQPSLDKSWQKSCSDPTLNGGTQAKCGANDCSSQNYDPNFGDRMICDENNETGSYQVESQNEINYLVDLNVGQMSCFDQQISAHSAQQIDYNSNSNSCDHNLVSLPYVDDNSNLVTDVPGIKICAIDDESVPLFKTASEQSHVNPGDGMMPDTTNLQSAPPVENGTNYECPQTMRMPSNRVPNYDPQGNDNNPSYSRGDRFVHQAQAADTYWPVQMTSENLYAPRVSNSLSVSECGLTTTTCQSNMPISTSIMNGSGIMRSHSHNSIDHLTKRASKHTNTPTGIIYNGDSQNVLGQQQLCANQTFTGCSQYDYQMNQFLSLQTDCAGGSAGLRFRRSNNSINAEHGSVSPANSSLSNLNSPQSEQNSPGSSNNEYGDYLPYQSTNSARMGQCITSDSQWNDNNNNSIISRVDQQAGNEQSSQSMCLSASEAPLSSENQQLVYHQSPTTNQQTATMMTNNYQEHYNAISCSGSVELLETKFHSSSTLVDQCQSSLIAGVPGQQVSCQAHSNSLNSSQTLASKNH